MLAEIELKRLSAGDFDEAADPIDAGAIVPASAGFVHQKGEFEWLVAECKGVVPGVGEACVCVSSWRSVTE